MSLGTKGYTNLSDMHSIYSFPFFRKKTRRRKTLLIDHPLLINPHIFCYEIMQETKVPILWLKSMSKLNLGASEKSVEKTNIFVFWKQLRVVRHNVVCLDNRTLSWYTALRESITCLVWRLSLKSLSQKETSSFTFKAGNPIKGARKKIFYSYLRFFSNMNFKKWHQVELWKTNFSRRDGYDKWGVSVLLAPRPPTTLYSFISSCIHHLSSIITLKPRLNNYMYFIIILSRD